MSEPAAASGTAPPDPAPAQPTTRSSTRASLRAALRLPDALRRRPRPSARTRALAGVGVALVLTGGAAALPVPYAVLSPGPTADTVGELGGQALIRVQGRETFPTEGSLQLTTVRVAGSPERGVDLFTAMWGWADRHNAVVPSAAVFAPGETDTQNQQRNAESMQISQQEATTAAMRELGVPVAAVLVRSVLEGAPALGKLKAGDEVLAIDGKRVTAAAEVREAVSARRPGETLAVQVRRDGREVTEQVTTGSAPDGGGAAPRTVIGIALAERYPFTVDISTNGGGQPIGGPSAGLMFALGIVDKLTPGPLTGGREVAGTGTIDAEGRVGPIGGIQQKLVGARAAGATVFLTPEANCSSALDAVPDGLRLVKVRTLDDAVAALDALRASGTGTGSTGGASTTAEVAGVPPCTSDALTTTAR